MVDRAPSSSSKEGPDWRSPGKRVEEEESLTSRAGASSTIPRMDIKWVPAIRQYEQEQRRALAPRLPAEANHPLMPRRLREEVVLRSPSSSPAAADKPPPPPSKGATPSSSSSPLLVVMKRGSSGGDDAIGELDPLSAMLLAGEGNNKGDATEPAFMDPLANPPPPAASPRTSTTPRGGSGKGASSFASPYKGGALAGGGGYGEEEEEKPSWSSRKQAILSEFAIKGPVRMRTRLLVASDSREGEEGDDQRGRGRKVVAAGGGDRYQQRLGQLEASLGGGELGGGGPPSTREMTQKEYLAHVERLQAELQRAWMNEERVLSLKLSIQCAKLLGDATSQPRYYPSMFVHVTDVLDSFGAMVFDRLRAKAVEQHLHPPPYQYYGKGGGAAPPPAPILPEDFCAADVSDAAKETCRNWFFKTACIRELLPRFYIECAFIRCYRFLADDEAPAVLTRLAGIVRGVGDPLIAAYARAYLARQAVHLRVDDNRARPLMLALLADHLTHLRDFRSHRYYHATYLAGRAGGTISDDDYVHLQGPALDWLMRVLARQPCSKEVFTTVMGHYRDLSNSPTVLRLVIETFDPSFYSSSSLALVALAKDIPDITDRQLLSLLASLGSRLQLCPPPPDHRLPLLNDVWRIISKVRVAAGEEDEGHHHHQQHHYQLLLDEYCITVSAWVGLAAKAYGEREVLIMLADLARQLQEAQGGEGATVLLLSEAGQDAMESIVRTVIRMEEEGGGKGGLVTSEHVMKVMDVVSRPGRKVGMCKDLLEGLARRGRTTDDPVLMHAVLEIARTLHDSLDSLSPEGEVRHISTLITTGFITLIDMGPQHLEQELSIYVDCRAAFPDLDLVLDCLVLRVLKLAMTTHHMATTTAGGGRGGHTRKSSAFVRACLAYCHITIPSLNDVLRRLSLMLLCGEVALLAQCLPQTDTFFKSAITLIPDVPSHHDVDYRRVPTEARLAGLVSSLLSALVVVPGHPEHGPLYLVQGLLNALQRFDGWQPRSGIRIHLHIQVLGLLLCYAQRRLPYHVPGVESNDVLYGGTPGYMAEVRDKWQALLHHITADIINTFGDDSGGDDSARQGSSSGTPRSGRSNSGGGGSHNAVVKQQQGELALELVNQLMVACRLDDDGGGDNDEDGDGIMGGSNGSSSGGMQDVVEKMMALAEPLQGQPYHRSTLERLRRTRLLSSRQSPPPPPPPPSPLKEQQAAAAPPPTQEAH